MPERLLLIADDDSLGQLRDCGELPEQFFVRPQYSELLGWHTAPDASCAVLPADMLSSHTDRRQQAPSAQPAAAEQGGAAVVGDVERAQLVQWIVEGLGDVTLCVVARCRRHTAAASNTPAEVAHASSASTDTAVSQPVVDDFDQAVGLFRDLADRLSRHSQIRSARVQAVLVAVFESPAEPQQLSRYVQAVQSQRDRLICRGYLMGPCLEAGLERAEVFYAEHVWPLLVSGLAAALWLQPVTQEDTSRSGTICAWRVLQLQADILQTRLRHAAEYTTREVRRLLENRLPEVDSPGATDNSNLLQRIPEQYDPIERLRPAQHLLSAGWLNTRFEAAAEEVVTGSRWESHLQAAGHTDSLERSRLLLGSDQRDDVHIRRGWSEVCRNPGAAGRLLNDRRGGFVTELRRSMALRHQQWQDLRRRDRWLQISGQDFAQCCQTLQLTASGYVGGGRRTLAAVAMLVALGWFCWRAGRQLFPGSPVPWWLLLSAAGGVLATTLLTAWLEQRAGQRGLQRLRESRARLDGEQEERHHRAESVVRAAEKLRRQRMLVLQDARDRWLLSRVVSALGLLTEQSTAATSQPQRLQRMRSAAAMLRSEQRRLLRGILHLRQVFHTMPSEETCEQQLQLVCAGIVQDFLQRDWQPFAMQSSAGLRGWLPGPQLRHLFENLRSRLQLAVQQELQRQAVLMTSEHSASDSATGTTWVAGLRAIDAAAFLQALSCRQEPAAFVEAGLQPPPLLLLEESVVRMQQHYPPTALLHVVPAPRTAHLPCVGLWFEQRLLRPEQLATVVGVLP